MTLRQLHAAMLRIARKFRLRTNYAYFGARAIRRSPIESVAHELAHGIDLCGWPMPTNVIGRAVKRMGDRAADQHELRVQRIEVRALRSLGVRMCPRELSRRTEWRNGPNPTPSEIRARLTQRERRGVAMFLAIVLAEAGAP